MVTKQDEGLVALKESMMPVSLTAFDTGLWANGGVGNAT